MMRLAVSAEPEVAVAPGPAPVSTTTFSPTVSCAAVDAAPLSATVVALVTL
jgi:hypothetical protein